jgi:hypothetical protein
MRNIFIDELILATQKNRNIVLLVNDLGFGVIEKFVKKFPNNYYNVHKNKWECKDNAYFNVYNEKYIPFESNINNLYNLGTHNGKSYISYTTIESAVSNAIYLAGEIYPEVQSKYTIYKGITGKNIVMVIIVIISVLLYYFLTR